MHPTVNIAVRAARAAGDIILRYHNQVDLLTIENKSENDFVYPRRREWNDDR